MHEWHKKGSKPDTFNEASCKTGIDSKGLTRVTLKPNQSVVTAKENARKIWEVHLQIDKPSIRGFTEE